MEDLRPGSTRGLRRRRARSGHFLSIESAARRTGRDPEYKALFPGLDDVRFRRFVEMLGGLSGRVLNYSEVARALGVSQPTARDYLDIAHGTFVWRTIPAYTRDTVKRVVKHPRGYLRDSGLLHYDDRIVGLPFTHL